MTRIFLSLLMLIFCSVASAQVNVRFGPSGQLLMGNSAIDAAASVIRNAAYAPSSTLGLPATATVSTTAAIGSAEGAAVGLAIPTTVTTGLSAATIARGVLSIGKTTAIGIGLGLATEALLNNVHLSFGPNGSVIENPPPTTGSCWKAITAQSCFPDAQSACDDAGSRYWGVTGSLTTVPVGDGSYFCQSNQGSTFGIAGITGAPTQAGCPNGVQFNNTTQCRASIDDALALQKLTPAIDTSNAADIAAELDVRGQPLTADQPAKVSMPGTVTSTPTTKTKPDGSTETTTTTASTSCLNNSCNVNITNTTVARDVAGTITGTTTETKVADPTTPAKQPDLKTCGLPSTPPCKIDETGTPDGKNSTDQAKADYNSAGDARKDQITNAGKETSLPFNNAIGLPNQASCPTISWLVRSRTVAQSQASDCTNADKVRSVIEWGISMFAALYISGLAVGIFGYNGK